MPERLRDIFRRVLTRAYADEAFLQLQHDKDAWQVVRESPVPVAMIAAGTVWLFATSQAPAVSRIREQLKSRLQGAFGSDDGETRLRPRSEEPAPIGPPPETGGRFDRMAEDAEL